MNTDPDLRFFYHTFPRSRPGVDLRSKGLSILRSMCRNGLLLVPEHVAWHDPTGSRQGDQIHAVQRRICFTELAPFELAQHAEMFGPFSLEYTIQELRAWGALPVVYVPDAINPEPSLEWTGVSLLARLADAQQVIRSLVETQHLTAPTIEMDLRIRNGPVHTRKFNEQETAAIRDYITFVQGAPGQHLGEIINALRALSSLFYPTEHPRYTGLLGYYRQREWRFFSGAFVNGRPTTAVANAEQQAELLQIDDEFFRRKLMFGDGEATLAEKSHYFPEVAGRHPLTALNRLIVPSETIDEAKSILAGSGFDVPVLALEEL